MPNTYGTNSKNIRDNLVSTEYQPLEGAQPPVHFGEKTGFQAVITSPWVLRWSAIPATYATYRTIRKNSTVALARELAVTPIIASEWTIKAIDDDVPKEWENYVRDVFMPLRDEYLATALYFGDIDFGYQCWEKIIEPADGYLKITRLKALLQDITEICIGHKGGFIGVRQVGQNLGLNNSIHCGFRVEGSYLYGIPLLENIRNIYNMWTDCNEGARRYDRKIAGSHIVVEYPPGSSFDRYGKEVENSILAYQILNTLESAGGIAVPRDLAAYMQLLNTQDPGWKIWIMDSGGGHQHSFTDRLEYLDKQYARGLHVPERAMMEGRHGTLAEAEAHGDVIFTIQDIKHRRVTDELNRQAVKQMLYLNFGHEAIKGGHPRVKLVASPIADKQKLLFTQLYTQLLGSPAGQQELLSIDMKSMRDQLGIPTHPVDSGQAAFEQQQGQPQLQGIPGVSQGTPGGPGRNLVALDKDGHPVTVDGNQPPQQLAQAMANAIEGMSKAVALSSSTIQKLALSGENDTEPHKFTCVMADFPEPLRSKCLKFGLTIPNEELDEQGREADPHVTVLYGLHTNDKEDIQEVLENPGPIKIRLGKLKIFPANESQSQRGGSQYDVLYAPVKSPELLKLNKTLKELPFTSKYPKYVPHCCIAYLKPGEGKKYVGRDDLEGEECEIGSLTFSPVEGQKCQILLKDSKEEKTRTCSSCHMGTVYLEDGRCQNCGAKSLKLSNEEEMEPHVEHSWDGPKHLEISYKSPEGGQIGWASFHASKEQPGYMHSTGIWVDKPFRREGAARKMYDYAHKAAKEAGYEGLLSHIENRSKDAEALWSSFPKKKLGEWDLFDPVEMSNRSPVPDMPPNLTGDLRTLPTMSNNFSGSIPELVGQSLDADNEKTEHNKEVRNYELPTQEEWAEAQKIIPPQVLAQIELGIENLNLGKSGPQIVGIPGTYAGDVVGLHIAVVDGDWIKLYVNPDYVEGDNCLHSTGIIPKGWAYVDRNVYKHDRDPIAMHEITETLLEKAGWDYDKAHRSANQFEDNRRKKLGIGMANEPENAVVSEPIQSSSGSHPYNKLFDKKISELQIADPEAKAAAESTIGKNHMGYIARSLHNVGFTDPQALEEHTNDLGADILTGNLFDTYDESKGATYPTLFKTYVRNGIFGLQRARKQSSRAKQDTSEDSEESPLTNVEGRIPYNEVFDPTRSTNHLDFRAPKEEKFINKLREHVANSLGELGLNFLNAKLEGKKYKDIDIGDAAPWVRKSLPPKLHKAIREFAVQQDNPHLNWLLDKLNKEKGLDLDNESEPVWDHIRKLSGLALAGTLGDTLGARPLASSLAGKTASRGSGPIAAQTANSGPIKPLANASAPYSPVNRSNGLPPGMIVAFSNESEDEVELAF